MHAPNGDYAPTCLLSRENLDVMLQVPKWAGVQGTVIWGGGSDQSSAALCKSFRTYFFETLGPAVASAVAGTSPPPPSPAPAPAPHYQPTVIMPPVQGGDPSPFMDHVSGPAFLHIPGTETLLLAVMDFADNVLFTRSTDLGLSWSNATKAMPQCNWVVNGSIHCDWGAQQLACTAHNQSRHNMISREVSERSDCMCLDDAKSATVFLAVGNSTGGLGKGHGCDDGDGNEENGAWILKSTDAGASWGEAVKVAPPASPTHCMNPVMGNGAVYKPAFIHTLCAHF